MTRERAAWLLLVLALVGAGLAGRWSAMHHPRPDLVTYEDGSGVLYDGDREVRTYPEGTFPWDCHRQGNRRCGAGAR